jgi:hypothetical protein
MEKRFNFLQQKTPNSQMQFAKCNLVIYTTQQK